MPIYHSIADAPGCLGERIAPELLDNEKIVALTPHNHTAVSLKERGGIWSYLFSRDLYKWMVLTDNRVLIITPSGSQTIDHNKISSVTSEGLFMSGVLHIETSADVHSFKIGDLEIAEKFVRKLRQTLDESTSRNR